MSDVNAPPSEKRYLCCIGWRLDNNGKVQQMWRRVDPENSDELKRDEIFWRAKKIVGAKPGAVYVFTYDENSTWLSGKYGPVFDGMWHDAEKIAEFQALSVACKRADDARRAAEKLQAEDYIEKSLTPILRAMRRATPAQRAAIKLLVMERLDKYSNV